MTNIWIKHHKNKSHNTKKMGKNKLHMRIRAILYKVYLKKSEENHPFSCTIQKLFLPLHRQNKNNGIHHTFKPTQYIQQRHGTSTTTQGATPTTQQTRGLFIFSLNINKIPSKRGDCTFFSP